MAALYAEHCEEHGYSKAWDVDEITNRVEKIISKSEHFEISSGCVQLTDSGKTKFAQNNVAASE